MARKSHDAKRICETAHTHVSHDAKRHTHTRIANAKPTYELLNAHAQTKPMAIHRHASRMKRNETHCNNCTRISHDAKRHTLISHDAKPHARRMKRIVERTRNIGLIPNAKITRSRNLRLIATRERPIHLHDRQRRMHAPRRRNDTRFA